MLLISELAQRVPGATAHHPSAICFVISLWLPSLKVFDLPVGKPAAA